MLISAPPMVFTHLQVKEAFPHLAFWERKSSPVGTRSRTGEGLGESPELPGGEGKLAAATDAHLDGVLPRVILGEQLISIRMQLVDGLLLLLQLAVDEVLGGERRDTDPHAKREDPACVL